MVVVVVVFVVVGGGLVVVVVVVGFGCDTLRTTCKSETQTNIFIGTLNLDTPMKFLLIIDESVS